MYFIILLNTLTILALKFDQHFAVLAPSKDSTSNSINNEGVQNEGAIQTDSNHGKVSVVNPINAVVFHTTALNDTDSDNDMDRTGANVTDTDVAAIRDQLAGLLETLCPGANICTEESSHTVSKQRVSRSDISCCTACSCSANCHMSGNCCFPPAGEDKKPGTGCYSSLYPQRENAELLRYPSYMMVDSVRTEPQELSIDCGNTNVAPWGSLYPMYSSSRSRIYKNSVCAAADGVNDAVQFRANVACNMIEFVTRGALFTSSIWENFHKYCDVWFTLDLPDELLNVLHKHKCYKNLVSTCPNKFHHSSLIPRDQVIAACNSGLLSPYRVEHGVMYKNVFCSVCNGDHHQRTCPQKDQAPRSTRSFVTLLKNVAFESFADKIPITKKHQACVFVKGSKVADTCRPVMCPASQMYSKDGVCKFIVQYWYDCNVMVNLQHKSDVPINTNEMNEASITFPSMWQWKVRMLYYFPRNEAQSSVSDTIMLILYRGYKSVNPKVALNTIRRLIDSKWTVKTTIGNISLRADFMDEHDRYSYTSAFNKSRLSKTIFYNARWSDNEIIIDQMSYCKQVRLRQGEFSIRGHHRAYRWTEYIFHNNLTNMLLIPAEYFFPDLSDNQTISVCIEKSGLLQVVNGGHTKEITAYIIVSLLALVIWFEYCNIFLRVYIF